jgi:UTP--glucose-1-phosphate uridylyltransferase
MIKKAIVPVAGLGTRFLPATKSVPKELFPILAKPVIQHLVEELTGAGIEEIVFVVNEQKDAIREHFSRDEALETIMKNRGKENLAQSIKEISELAKYHFVLQDMPLGDGHAILCAKEKIGNEPCFVIFGDTLVDAKPSMVKQMLQVHDEHEGSIIAVMEVPGDKTASYGIISPAEEGEIFKIDDLVEKPEPENAPSNLAIIGAYIITPAVFDELEKSPSSVGGEIRLIDGFHLLREKEPLYGCHIHGEWLDTGTVSGWLKANIHYALKSPEISQEIHEFISKIS